MTISSKMAAAMQSSSWIRRMFEEGAELKARLGEEAVCDFTLGNPDLEPPEAVKAALAAVSRDPGTGLHAYMPNAGLPQTRRAVADYLTAEHGLVFAPETVVMTCGAAGALNIILKSLLDPWEEVVIFAPYFPEYLFYIENHGGAARVVETDAEFQIDPAALEAALTPQTKAVLINTPNNPTGQVYDQDRLEAVAAVLAAASAKNGRPIYLINDEPYRRLVYDGRRLPNLFALYPDTILATSFSKDLSLPGERVGYAAVSPRAQYRQELMGALILANRILGFVNAPALFQRVVADQIRTAVDITPYARRRELFYRILREAGYEVVKPRGAFYFFPRSPQEDDVAFVQRLKQENILAVPGRGFGRAGYFRLAFCVPEAVIERAAAGLARARQG